MTYRFRVARDISDKAWAIQTSKSELFFIPKSFDHKVVAFKEVDIELPQWFIDKNKDTINLISIQK